MDPDEFKYLNISFNFAAGLHVSNSEAEKSYPLEGAENPVLGNHEGQTITLYLEIKQLHLI